MRELEEALTIAKDLLQIVVLILTASKLLKKDKPRNKPKRRRGK